MLRKILVSAAGILLLAGSFYLARVMANSKKTHSPHSQNNRTAVMVQEVQNGIIPVSITASGQVHAREKVELYAEVQGIMERGSRRFFEGTYFNKGEVMISINRDEFVAGLKAQRASLFNQIVGIMPDLRLDYPEAAPAWEAYIAAFNVNERLPKLPEAQSEQEKFYVAGKGIYTSYYNIKNLEVRLDKHSIRAPFNGHVTESMVREGTLIRQGQKLGEFVAPDVFELKLPVNASYEPFLRVGKKVRTTNLEKTSEWNGTITRVNRKLDTKTQTILVIIELRAPDLWDGMYLEAELDAQEIDNAFEINRKLLSGENAVFVVRDSTLESIFVDPVYYKDGRVIVKNIPDGSLILQNPVPGAHNGMQVEIFGS